MSTTKYWLDISSNRNNPDWQEISLAVSNCLSNSFYCNSLTVTNTGYPPDQPECDHCGEAIYPSRRNEYWIHKLSEQQSCNLLAIPKPAQSSQTPVKPTIHSVVEWNANYGRTAGLWLKVGKIELFNVEKMIYNIRDNYDGSLCVNVPWNSITRIIEP